MREPVAMNQDNIFSPSESLSSSFNFNYYYSFWLFKISGFLWCLLRAEEIRVQDSRLLSCFISCGTSAQMARLCHLYKMEERTKFPDSKCPKYFKFCSFVKGKESITWVVHISLRRVVQHQRTFVLVPWYFLCIFKIWYLIWLN